MVKSYNDLSVKERKAIKCAEENLKNVQKMVGIKVDNSVRIDDEGINRVDYACAWLRNNIETATKKQVAEQTNEPSEKPRAISSCTSSSQRVN